MRTFFMALFPFCIKMKNILSYGFIIAQPRRKINEIFHKFVEYRLIPVDL